jgi:NADH-quinone oxidoreductase subunit C/D
MNQAMPDNVSGPSLELDSQVTQDGIRTVWLHPGRLIGFCTTLKHDPAQSFAILLDITAVDERERRTSPHHRAEDFTLVYHFVCPQDAEELRVKVPLRADALRAPSLSALWPNANWYEREVWDMFGVTFEGHPDLRRILMPESWQGHPLQKDHFSRATEHGPFEMSDAALQAELASMQTLPVTAGMVNEDDSDTMILNLGPNHPSLHGVLRLVVKLKGEEIVDVLPEIGFHHRGAEKIGERQSWHSFIPYTDRIDYVAGVMNNLPYVLAVEKLAGIAVPDRAQTIRVMLAELFRIISHLVFFGTMVQDVGQLSPVFYAFTDRERALEVIETICGFRMHPAWFRIGGVAGDLPSGWDDMIRDLIRYLQKRLRDYEPMVMRNRIFKARTIGIGEYTADEAVEWGVTGPGLRACGVALDWRKARPYSGYEQFRFDVPTANRSDCYNRVRLRLDEIWESLRIIAQCVEDMPPGPIQARHPLAMPQPRADMLKDIDTLIPHFLNASWGAVIPAGEAAVTIEAAKGLNTYALISDGGTGPYRVRIRTPSFAHLQTIPMLCRGVYLADLIAIIGSIDFVMADVDR